MDDEMLEMLGPTVGQVVHAMLKRIGDGCRSVGEYGGKHAELSKEATEFFWRRYALSIRKKLKDTPKDWPNETILATAFAVGQIAGGIWLFWQKAHPSDHQYVDTMMLRTSCHVMELECKDFLVTMLRPGVKVVAEEDVNRGGYCN